MKTAELEAIIQEEMEIVELEDLNEAGTQSALRRALSKLQRNNYEFTPTEESAIKYALEDVGELYLFAGTSGGFDVVSKEDVRGYQSRGQKAREQAAALGIRLRDIGTRRG